MAEFTDDLWSQLIFGDKPPKMPGVGAKNFRKREFLSSKAAALQAINEALAQSRNFGQSLFDDIAANTARQHSRAGQNLTSRGLGNTTVVDSARRAIDSDASRQRRSAFDLINQRVTDLLQAKANIFRDQFGAPVRPSSGGGDGLGGILGGLGGALLGTEAVGGEGGFLASVLGGL